MVDRVEILGEEAIRRVTVGGYLVPHLSVQEIPATGEWNVIYDGRFCVLAADLEEVARWLPFIANVQAVADGYSCHGENSIHHPNPHKVRAMRIDYLTGTPEG